MTPDEIGEGRAALFCFTNKIHCCSSVETTNGTLGEWFFPNETRVRNISSEDGFYRGSGPSIVALHRRNNANRTGVFRCQIPDTGTNQQLYVGVYPLNSGSPNITGLSYDQPTLTLTCTSTGGPATTVTWTRNDSEIMLDETNIQEKNIISRESGSYQSNLVFVTTLSAMTVYKNITSEFTCNVSNLRGSSEGSVLIEG